MSQNLVSDILNLLQYLARISVKLLCNGSLLVWVQLHNSRSVNKRLAQSSRNNNFSSADLSVLLAQVAVNYVFDREVRASVAHVISATQWRVFLPQMHFQVGKEIHVFSGSEG